MPRKPLRCLRRGYGRSIKGRRRKANGALMRPYGNGFCETESPPGRHLAPMGPLLLLGAALHQLSALMPKSAQPQGGEQDTRPAPAGARPKGLRRSPPGELPWRSQGWPIAFRLYQPNLISESPPASRSPPHRALLTRNSQAHPSFPAQPHHSPPQRPPIRRGKISVDGNSRTGRLTSIWRP